MYPAGNKWRKPRQANSNASKEAALSRLTGRRHWRTSKANNS